MVVLPLPSRKIRQKYNGFLRRSPILAAAMPIVLLLVVLLSCTMATCGHAAFRKGLVGIFCERLNLSPELCNQFHGVGFAGTRRIRLLECVLQLSAQRLDNTVVVLARFEREMETAGIVY